MKVYELAKKLEVTSVFLMNKIRKEWKLPIKSHMETLTPDLIQEIENKFFETTKKTTSKKATTKKTTSKKVATKKTTSKKVATKKTTSKKATTKKTTSKKVATKKTTSKKTKPALVDENITEKKEENPPIIQRKLIIRREKASIKPVSSEPATEVKKLTTPEEKIPFPANRSPASDSIRMDLVSVKTTDPLAENFWNKQEATPTIETPKKQPKKPIAEKDVSSKFNATDFRKREVIFQPRKKRIAQAGEFKNTQITTPKTHKRIIKIHGEISTEALSKKLGIKKRALLRKLKEEGIDTTELTTLDFDTISLIVPTFNFEAKNTKQTEKEMLENLGNKIPSQENKNLVLKPPVVTIMGHVDHGKTTLLDFIRKTKVAEGEAGGITQHIGAYSVPSNNSFTTFIDTPGHEAFTAMRSRGAQATDIVIIIVAATDGMKPQTLEALNHAKAAKIPIIIAISKIDLPGANIDKIKQQMSEHDIVPEDWGGDTSFIPISALKGEGIKNLLEQIQLVAEVQELKCDPTSPAQGIILEARKEKGLGCIVNLLIKNGTLKSGQNILAGECMGRIRQMKNDQGKIVKEMGPGFPVEAVGFNELPQAGDVFHIVANEKAAKNLLDFRKAQNANTTQKHLMTPEEMLLQMELSKEEEKKELHVILKADVRGSLEALKSSLEKIKSEEISVKIIHSGAGAITESDILLASTVSGIVLGFNVRPNGKAAKLAKEKSVEIYTYSIIYELLDQVKQLLLGLLKVEFKDEEQGAAEVREVFHISKIGTIAGSYVTSGQIHRNSLIRLIRDGRLVYEGSLSSLRRFKEDVKQVGTGLECGITLDKFNDIKPKDILEAYTKKEIPRTEL